MAMAMAKGNGARKSESVWCRPSVGVMATAMAMCFMVIVSTQLGGGAADSTIQNLSKATMYVDDRELVTGGVLTIAISSGGTTTVDLSYTKNITGLKIQDGKEYLVVQNQAGTSAILAGQNVVTLDFVEAKVIEEAF